MVKDLSFVRDEKSASQDLTFVAKMHIAATKGRTKKNTWYHIHANENGI